MAIPYLWIQLKPADKFKGVSELVLSQQFVQPESRLVTHTYTHDAMSSLT